MRLALLALLAAGPAHGYELKQRLERLMGPAYPPHNIGQVYVTLRRLEASGLIENAGGGEGGDDPRPAPVSATASTPASATVSTPGAAGSPTEGQGRPPAPTPATPQAPVPAARTHRRTYRLTAAGREAVAAWFEQPVEQPRPRSEFFLKLALAPLSGMADQEALINQQRRHHLLTLRQLAPLTRVDAGEEPTAPSRTGAGPGPAGRTGRRDEEPPADRSDRDPRIARLLAVGAMLHLQADLDWLEQCQRELE